MTARSEYANMSTGAVWLATGVHLLLWTLVAEVVSLLIVIGSGPIVGAGEKWEGLAVAWWVFGVPAIGFLSIVSASVFRFCLERTNWATNIRFSLVSVLLVVALGFVFCWKVVG